MAETILYNWFLLTLFLAAYVPTEPHSLSVSSVSVINYLTNIQPFRFRYVVANVVLDWNASSPSTAKCTGETVKVRVDFSVDLPDSIILTHMIQLDETASNRINEFI